MMMQLTFTLTHRTDMGQTSSLHEFEWKHDQEPHKSRREAILSEWLIHVPFGR